MFEHSRARDVDTQGQLVPFPLILQIRDPSMPSTLEANRSVGESRKVWKNIMELKIEKTKTMTNTWRKIKTKRDKDKNVGE